MIISICHVTRINISEQNGEPDVSNDGNKKENVFGISNREFCDHDKTKTGKISRPGTLEKLSLKKKRDNNGLIEEVDSVINSKQKIHYPIVLPSESTKETKQDNDNGDVISIHSWLESGIRRLEDSARLPFFYNQNQ